MPAVLWQAYDAAAQGAPAGCHLPTTLLAAIGQVESGSLAGRALDPGHRVVPAVLGPVLDGGRFAAIADTDHGELDGNRVWDRAVGPMQFIPGTWVRWQRDGDQDGTADPQDIEDAAATAAAYLCADGRDLATEAGLRSAILAYNHSTAYLALVLRWKHSFEVIPPETGPIETVAAEAPEPPVRHPSAGAVPLAAAAAPHAAPLAAPAVAPAVKPVPAPASGADQLPPAAPSLPPAPDPTDTEPPPSEVTPDPADPADPADPTPAPGGCEPQDSEPTDAPPADASGDPTESGDPTDDPTGKPTEGPTGKPTEGPTEEPPCVPACVPAGDPTGDPDPSPPAPDLSADPTAKPAAKPPAGSTPTDPCEATDGTPPAPAP
ncbi:hypothetical protein EFL26_18890 [Nocardioides pocheonensis]|uniref:Transglycosylase SLT domain-containing protein n=1 Tax=Nocardioides pocheonensis TaxID=661485 RepID=A0A3N0GJT6_9ACTN|nr:hypothetical protein EFL26_18890 [Nocardioides pocheonensis]